jgi:hypothetical protein
MNVSHGVSFLHFQYGNCCGRGCDSGPVIPHFLKLVAPQMTNLIRRGRKYRLEGLDSEVNLLSSIAIIIVELGIAESESGYHPGLPSR